MYAGGKDWSKPSPDATVGGNVCAEPVGAVDTGCLDASTGAISPRCYIRRTLLIPLCMQV